VNPLYLVLAGAVVVAATVRLVLCYGEGTR
jgi:hypothetical protein